MGRHGQLVNPWWSIQTYLEFLQASKGVTGYYSGRYGRSSVLDFYPRDVDPILRGLRERPGWLSSMSSIQLLMRGRNFTIADEVRDAIPGAFDFSPELIALGAQARDARDDLEMGENGAERHLGEVLFVAQDYLEEKGYLQFPPMTEERDAVRYKSGGLFSKALERYCKRILYGADPAFTLPMLRHITLTSVDTEESLKTLVEYTLAPLAARRIALGLLDPVDDPVGLDVPARVTAFRTALWGQRLLLEGLRQDRAYASLAQFWQSMFGTQGHFYALPSAFYEGDDTHAGWVHAEQTFSPADYPNFVPYYVGSRKVTTRPPQLFGCISGILYTYDTPNEIRYMAENIHAAVDRWLDYRYRQAPDTFGVEISDAFGMVSDFEDEDEDDSDPEWRRRMTMDRLTDEYHLIEDRAVPKSELKIWDSLQVDEVPNKAQIASEGNNWMRAKVEETGADLGCQGIWIHWATARDEKKTVIGYDFDDVKCEHPVVRLIPGERPEFLQVPPVAQETKRLLPR